MYTRKLYFVCYLLLMLLAIPELISAKKDTQSRQRAEFNKAEKYRIKKISEIAGKLENHENNFGSMGFSAPVITHNQGQFAFQLNNDGDHYYNKAIDEVQGGAAIMNSFLRQTGLSSTLKADVVQMIQAFAAFQALQVALSATESILNPVEAEAQQAAAWNTFRTTIASISSEQPSTSSSDNATTATTVQTIPTNAPAFSGTGFSNLKEQLEQVQNGLKTFDGFQKLFDDSFQSPTISQHDAILVAAHAFGTQSLITFMTNPKTAAQFKDKHVFFGVSTVGVNPGRKTRKGYSGRIDIQTEYSWVEADPVLGKKIAENYIQKDFPLLSEEIKKYLSSYYGIGSVPHKQEPNTEKEPSTSLDLEKDSGPSDDMAEKSNGHVIGGAGERLDTLYITGRLRKQIQEILKTTKTLSSKNGGFDKNENIQTGKLNRLSMELTNLDSSLDIKGLLNLIDKIDEVEKMDVSNITSKESYNRIKKELNELIEHKKKLNSLHTEPMGAKPHVVPITPLAENQVLDLGFSLRRRQEFALKAGLLLTALDAELASEFFENRAKDLKQDIRTRTPSTVLNAHSSSGYMFSFEIGPELRAIEDPSEFKSGPGNILERQTFPVLLAIGVDYDDIKPRVRIKPGGNACIIVPRLNFTQTSTWKSSSKYAKRVNTKQLTKLSVELKDLENSNYYYDHHPYHSVRNFIVSGFHFLTLNITDSQYKSTNRLVDYSGSLELLKYRLNASKTKLFGSVSYVGLPEEIYLPNTSSYAYTPPKINKVTPIEVPFNKETEISIFGTGLDQYHQVSFKAGTKNLEVVAGSRKFIPPNQGLTVKVKGNKPGKGDILILKNNNKPLTAAKISVQKPKVTNIAPETTVFNSANQIHKLTAIVTNISNLTINQVSTTASGVILVPNSLLKTSDSISWSIKYSGKEPVTTTFELKDTANNISMKTPPVLIYSQDTAPQSSQAIDVTPKTITMTKSQTGLQTIESVNISIDLKKAKITTPVALSIVSGSAQIINTANPTTITPDNKLELALKITGATQPIQIKIEWTDSKTGITRNITTPPISVQIK